MFDNKLRKFISPQLEFHSFDNSEKFFRTFFELYRIELFKDGLDLILTKLKENHLKFEVHLVKGWDTNVGCFLTERKSFFDKTFGKFVQKNQLKIIIRQLTHNVLAHEMAHALEFESGINLGEEFRTAIGYDMKGREPQSFALKGEKNRLMIEALKSYPPHQFLSELFARYFELLSISRNVSAHGAFTTAEVMEFFENTTIFIEKIFNPKIRGQIDQDIAIESKKIVTQLSQSEPKEKFQERIESRQQKFGTKWSKAIKSNSSYQEGWKKYQAIEEDKK